MINKKIKYGFLLMVLTIPMVLSGCKDSASKNKPNEKKLLTEGDWVHYNSTTCEEENIIFNKDNEYLYFCSCGEPVGNSDVYDTYSYDGDGKITLKASYEDGPEEIPVNILYIDDMTLLIDLRDDIVEFYNSKKMSNCLHTGYEETCDDCIYYLDGYDGYSTILKMSDSELEIAPANYDGDTDDLFKDYKRTVTVPDDAKFYDLTANSSFKNEERINHECSFTELTKDEVTTMLEDSSSSALLWYNNDGQITKVIFYGTLVTYE